jgi:RecA-family ATPase
VIDAEAFKAADETAERAQAPRVLNLADYRAARYTGPPPQIKWLVKNSIPLGVPVLLASLGGVGKSYLSLQLGCEVTTPPIEDPKTDKATVINLNYQRAILGGTVEEYGKAVLITAEDSDNVVHRRLAVVDPHGRRTDDLIIVPLPSAGRNVRTRPAAETGATVIVCHHMRKTVNGKTPQTPAEAREAIRGSSALVDAARLAYPLWPVDQEEAERICCDLKIPFMLNRVIRGAIVKTNEIGGQEHLR